MINSSDSVYDTQLEVLVPVAPAEAPITDTGLRGHTIAGKRLGLFWNRKPNGDILLSRFGELLQERHSDTKIEWLQGKGDPAKGAPMSAIKEALKKCDAVILAAGD
ncbi:MAG: hypothetical protein A2144_13665 [Chloroflexi bacterium RBG_16_50_9]|nr:MAG: hypothetical protein A2144_13665 [Chloroflexi bacterium RBG_16_50_9]